MIFPIYRGYDTNNLILNRIFTPEISYNFVVMDIPKVNLGEIVKSLVEDRGLSKAEFAKSIGKARQNVEKTVFAKHGLDTDLVCRISEVLGCNLFDYFKCNEKKDVKATVTIELGSKKQEESFHFYFGENELNIK